MKPKIVGILYKKSFKPKDPGEHMKGNILRKILLHFLGKSFA